MPVIFFHQAYVQTNEDNLDRDIQTDEIETKEKWTQHPSEDYRPSGGPDEEEKDWEVEHQPVDMMKLNQFIERAGQVGIICVHSVYGAVNAVSCLDLKF